MMPVFIMVGYGDQDGYARTDAGVREDAHTHDGRLRAAGALMGVAGAPVQVRNHDASGTETTDGAFMRSSLPVAGFTVIDAADLDEAVMMASQTPCAVAHGVVEVWPLSEAQETTDGPART